jgi:hypothetical protein
MASANDNDMTPARRISVLERGIEKSLKDLVEVEAVLRSGTHPQPLKDGGLARRRVMLLKLIEEMEAKLRELKAEPDGETGACA